MTTAIRPTGAQRKRQSERFNHGTKQIQGHLRRSWASAVNTLLSICLRWSSCALYEKVVRKRTSQDRRVDNSLLLLHLLGRLLLSPRGLIDTAQLGQVRTMHYWEEMTQRELAPKPASVSVLPDPAKVRKCELRRAGSRRQGILGLTRSTQGSCNVLGCYECDVALQYAAAFAPGLINRLVLINIIPLICAKRNWIRKGMIWSYTI